MTELHNKIKASFITTNKVFIYKRIHIKKPGYTLELVKSYN